MVKMEDHKKYHQIRRRIEAGEDWVDMVKFVVFRWDIPYTLAIACISAVVKHMRDKHLVTDKFLLEHRYVLKSDRIIYR